MKSIVNNKESSLSNYEKCSLQIQRILDQEKRIKEQMVAKIEQQRQLAKLKNYLINHEKIMEAYRLAGDYDFKTEEIVNLTLPQENKAKT